MAKLNSISKDHIADRLSSFGFTITDISRSSPFDLLAVSPYYSLAVDVRHRWSKSSISIHKHEVTARLEYKLEVDDKILVFCTPRLADSYIKLSTLQSITETSCHNLYLLNNYYIIERHITHSLAEIRKILEVAHLL